MQGTNYKIIFFFLLIQFVSSCSKSAKEDSTQLDNYYFVKIDDIALPVRVCGNINSDVAVVFVHGGPGSSAQVERANIYWKEIEKRYKVIYYDQRGSGATQGKVAEKDMTIEKFSDDLNVIVDFAKQITKVDKVFIHGASWGGALATYYLTDTAHQNKLRGAIIESPAYDLVNGTQLSKQWVMPKADSFIMHGTNIEKQYWTNCKNYYAANPTITPAVFKQHQVYVTQLKGIIFNTINIQSRSVSIPKSEIALAYNNTDFALSTLKYEGQSIFTHLDLTSKLNQIQLPVFLAWGALDGLLPKNNLAQKFVTNIGSVDLKYETNKYLLSANSPHTEEWQQFDIDAVSFIEAHR